MKIVNKKQLAELPDNILFAPYSNYDIGEYRVKTCSIQYQNGSLGWNGELPLNPFLDIEEEHTDHKSDIIATQWCTTDTSDVDYDDDQLFAVFSKLEILQIIKCLLVVLNDGIGNIDMDAWIGFDDIVGRDD